MPFEGIRRDRGGIFLSDETQALYLAHNGRIGGGRKGIGKTAFLKYLGRTREVIEWPDRKRPTEVVVLGAVEHQSFLADLASYILAVESFKDSARGLPASVETANPDWNFTPEFEGTRQKYLLKKVVESRVSHGTVVTSLQSALASLGMAGFNSGRIDLLLRKGALITHLLEIKTEISTTSLYQAIGQLLFHGALERSHPRRILVLPGQVAPEIERRLTALDIRILRYDWETHGPTFRSLEESLQ